MVHTPPTSGLLGGRYQAEELLGWGGAGEVWQGRHVELGARVAIKLLRPGVAPGEQARRRFLTEARVMAQLDTSHAVRVFDVGVSEDGVPFLVMELVDGESLAQKLARERRLQPGTAARLLGQAARGLERAHALGIVHRDFKPANVLLSLDEEGQLRARVTDFGLAKLLGSLSNEADDEAPRSARGEASTGVAGTPYYMAPEQFRAGEAVSEQTDVWAFGVVAYECLAGQRPFVGDSPRELRRAVLRRLHRPASSLAPSLPRAFDAWFERACAAAPAGRFPSIRFASEALAEALGATSLPASHRPPRPPRPLAVDPLAVTHPATAPLPRRRRWARRLPWVLTAALAAAAFGLRLRPPAPPPALPAPLCSTPTAPASAPDPTPEPPPVAPAATCAASSPARRPRPAEVLHDYRPFPEAQALPRSFKADPY